MTSPVQRTLAQLRAWGWIYSISSSWNAFSKLRNDLWGCFDIEAISQDGMLHHIQVTSDSNHSARRKKIEASIPARRLSQRLYDRVAVWSWGKRGGRGQRKLWSLRIEWGRYLGGGREEWAWQDASRLAEPLDPSLDPSTDPSLAEESQ